MNNPASPTFRPGRYYQLTRQTGPFPQGIYRLERVEGSLLEFSVGKARTTIFGVCISDPNVLREVSFRQGKREYIRVREFTRLYYQNLARFLGVDAGTLQETASSDGINLISSTGDGQVIFDELLPIPSNHLPGEKLSPFPLFDA